jgi:hypothetical protein
VARAIDILRTELIRTLKLLGCESVRQLDRSYVDIPAAWIREARPDLVDGAPRGTRTPTF